MPSVISPITPTSALDTYPVVESKYVKGGCQTWFLTSGDWTSTAILPLDRREAGMIVSSADAPTVKWQLGADLTTWTQLNTGAGDSRTWFVPETVLDPSGGVNPTDPTNTINNLITDASNAYNATLGPITLVFPTGQISMGEFIVKGNVIYIGGGGGFGGRTVINKRSDYVSGASFSTNVNRVLLKTVRKSLVNMNANDGCFSSWVDANPDNWYGNSDNIVFGGKFVFNQNNKQCGLHLCMFFEVRDMVVLPGAIEVWHMSGAPDGNRWWALYVCGRNITWFHPIVRYGTEIAQDGFHIVSGRNINVIGGYLESGDDAWVINQERGGGTTCGPDEGVSDVTATNVVVNSRQARGCAVQAGINYVNAPGTAAGRVTNVRCTGFVGKCAQVHGHGISVGEYRAPNAIGAYTYTNNVGANGYNIIAAGTGFVDGFYSSRPTTPVSGGGSGALCDITVAGGIVTRAMPKLGPAVGSGYTANIRVDLSGVTRSTATTTTAGFTMPAVSGTVVVTVASNTAFTIGGGAYIQSAGYFTVAAKGGSTTMDLVNTGHYQNAAPAAVIATTRNVSVGTAADVQGVFVSTDNSLVQGVDIQASFEIGSATHDNIEPWGLSLLGATNVDINYTVKITQNSGSPAHRPFFVKGAKKNRIKMKMLSATQESGAISTKQNSCGVIDELEFVDCYFLNPAQTSGGTIKLFSIAAYPLGDITMRGCTIDQINNGCSVVYAANADLTQMGTLTLKDNTCICTSGSPSNNYFLRTFGTGTGQIAQLVMVDNNLGGLDLKIDTTNFQAWITKYQIARNVGLPTRIAKLVSWAAGDTTKSITVDALPGLPDTSTLGLACVRMQWVTQPTNAIGNIWFTTSSATAFNANLATAPGGSGATSVVVIDVGQKGLVD